MYQRDAVSRLQVRVLSMSMVSVGMLAIKHVMSVCHYIDHRKPTSVGPPTPRTVWIPQQSRAVQPTEIT